MTPYLIILLSLLCGSLPFSVWLGKIILRQDIRQYGDGNPGAANVFRAGNRLVALLALLLDISKAAAPVGFAYFQLGYRGLLMFCVAVAPILGHAFSPFLHFKGGKALAVALGVWIGLTIWKASLPAILGVLVGISLFTIPGWAVICALGAILTTLLLWLPDPLFLSIWLGETLLLIWTHRADLQDKPHLRPWVIRLFRLK